MATNKKITKVDSGNEESNYTFKPSEENKSKATTLRIIAFVGWLIAIGLEVFAIFKLLNPLNMTWIIVVVVIAAALAITGNLLWKKANKLDPASKKNKFKFFVQSQLGAFMSALAFLPLLIMVLTNKDMDGKQKGILGGIVGVALLAAVGTGIDFNPPSVEEYTEKTNEVQALTGKNEVFWTEHGTKFHLFSDCYHINGEKTDEIFSGTKVSDALTKNSALRKEDAMCKTCRKKAEANPPATLIEEVLEEATPESENNENEEVLEGELAF